MILAALFVLAGQLLPQQTWAQSELQSRYFTTSDGVELHYLEAGSGPTLVFVPGWTMPAEIWEPQLKHFEENHRVIALDPRGQGRSEKVGYGYHPSRRAEDIGELLEHLDAGPAVVVGWSLGVQEVLVYTHESGTEHVRAVVLVDHMIEMDCSRFASRFVNVQVDRESWTREFIRAIYRTPQSEDYLEAVTQSALSTPTNAAAIMIGNLVLMGPCDLSPAMDALDLPVLFVASSQDWAVAEGERVRERWPGTSVVALENTGHTVFVDAPERFNSALEGFLSRLPTR
jgi:microsomal epoxide hydrolase